MFQDDSNMLRSGEINTCYVFLSISINFVVYSGDGRQAVSCDKKNKRIR